MSLIDGLPADLRAWAEAEAERLEEPVDDVVVRALRRFVTESGRGSDSVTSASRLAGEPKRQWALAHIDAWGETENPPAVRGWAQDADEVLADGFGLD